MSHQWDGNSPDWDREEHFLSAQQMSQRLATVVEGEGEDAFRSTRPSTTALFPPRSSSMPTAAPQTPLFASQRTTPAESIARYPVVGESLFGPFTPSISMSAPSRPSSNPATLNPAGSTVQNAPPGRTEPRFRPWGGTWLMTNPPRPARPPATLESPPAYSAVQYPASAGPASTTASLPPRLPSNCTPTQRTTLDSQPQTQSQTTKVEKDCCLQCAKGSSNLECGLNMSRYGNRCIRCVAYDVECTPIPAEYLPEFRSIQQLYRAGRKDDALAARKAWAESMEAETSLTRIERQLFLLNRNVERLLNVQLRMIGESASRSIEEEFPEN